MSITLNNLKQKLCSSLCEDINLYQKDNDLFYIETPFTFPDGDTYTIYLKLLTGGVRITDRGHTFMQLSYEMDIDTLYKGTRGKLREQIMNELALSEEEGQIYLDSSLDQLGNNLFRFSQGITKIHDLSFLNRDQVTSTFYEDLSKSLTHIVNPSIIQKDYVIPNISNAENYRIDYFIPGKSAPLYIFGIPNKDKARLATITLQHLSGENLTFESIIVCANQTELPRSDLARLTNAGGKMIASLDAREDLRREVLKRAA